MKESNEELQAMNEELKSKVAELSHSNSDLQNLMARNELLTSLEETRAARDEMESASAAKYHFLAVLSHGLRKPLTPVLFAAGAMRMRKDLSEEDRATMEMIERNVTLEARLIDDFLDMSCIGRGKLDLSRKHVDVHEIVSKAIEVSRPDIDGSVCIEVSDDAKGIALDRLEAIFDPFSQASVEITKTHGGLGLAIAIATVEARGGTISVASDGAGSGSKFVATLPVSASAPALE